MNMFRFLTTKRQWSTVSIQRYMAQKPDAPLSSASKHSSSTEDDNANEPVQFFGSQAATWRAKDTRSGGSDRYLWYQPYVISGSLAVFLLYFCVFREENDIDLKLEGKLYDHVQGLEELQLTMTYKYNKENSLDNREVVKRLTELGIDVNLLDAKVTEIN